MKRDMQVKQQVLEMLKDFLMNSDGGKFKPKAIEVEVMSAPKGGSLKDVLSEASECAPEYEDSLEDEARDEAMAEKRGMSRAEWEDSAEDEEMDEEAEENMPRKAKSIRDYFDR
jgi:hypothetical protein